MAARTEPSSVSIPLKPQERPVDVSNTPDFLRLISNEYITRYLQELGATPTKANMELVKDQLLDGADKWQVNAAFKSRGAVSDALQVTPIMPKRTTSVLPPSSAETFAHATIKALSEMPPTFCQDKTGDTLRRILKKSSPAPKLINFSSSMQFRRYSKQKI